MKYLFVLFFGAGLFYACRFIGGERVRGNGNINTQQRSMPSFEGVASFGSFDILLKTGENYSVTVEADENLLQYIETDVDGDNLEISHRDGYNLRPTSDIRIVVIAPRYNELSSHGSGNIKGDGLLTSNEPVQLSLFGSGNINVEMNAPAIKAQIAGSGNMKLSGTAEKFSSSIHGSGDIRAGDMKVDEGKVEIAGSGNVEVFANNKLDVHIMGSGGVKYRGNAQINTNIAGSGSVSKLN